MGKLDGKVTIVTGATSGIGRRTVEVFVAVRTVSLSLPTLPRRHCVPMECA